MNKILLIIDPQYDFINGSLGVEGAAKCMDGLSDYIRMYSNEYCQVVITQDWHPKTHCSFVENGGTWPTHCVADSHGSEIWENIMSAIEGTGITCTVLKKGNLFDREEYSIFRNFVSAAELVDLIKNNGVEQVDICGIAKDYCVFDTLKDGIKRFGGKIFNVLIDFTPAISEDGSKKFDDFLIEHEIKSTTFN